MKLFITITMLLWLLSACTRRVLVTLTHPHVVMIVDTIEDHVRYHIKPTGRPRSSLRNGLRPGDSLKVLKEYFIRVKPKNHVYLRQKH